MSQFFVVANACEYTGNPVAGTMQVFMDRDQAYAAVVRSEQEDPGQMAQVWAQRPDGGFRAVAMVEDNQVVYF